MFWAFGVIFFITIQDCLASGYYYRKINGNFDIYYGAEAESGYRQFKAPKFYKLSFGDRGGKCF